MSIKDLVVVEGGDNPRAIKKPREEFGTQNSVAFQIRNSSSRPQERRGKFASREGGEEGKRKGNYSWRDKRGATSLSSA